MMSHIIASTGERKKPYGARPFPRLRRTWRLKSEGAIDNILEGAYLNTDTEYRSARLIIALGLVLLGVCNV
jgi:hypothetical protein